MLQMQLENLRKSETMNSFARLIFLMIVTSQLGCAPMRSTPVTRQDDDSFCVQCPANGVPVVVSIPTHLKVTVYEQLFFKIEG